MSYTITLLFPLRAPPQTRARHCFRDYSSELVLVETMFQVRHEVLLLVIEPRRSKFDVRVKEESRRLLPLYADSPFWV